MYFVCQKLKLLQHSFMHNTNFNANYSVYPEEKLVLEYQGGVVNGQDLINYKKRMADDSSFSSSFNVLVDIRDSIYKEKLSGVANYVSFLKTRPDIAGNRKVAVLTNRTNQVVIAFMYQNMQQDLKQIVEVFSTLEAIKNWLNIKMPIDKIQSELTRLSQITIKSN